MNTVSFEANWSNEHIFGEGAADSIYPTVTGTIDTVPLRFVHVYNGGGLAFACSADDEVSLLDHQDNNDDISSVRIASLYQLGDLGQEARAQSLKSDVAPDQPLRKESLHVSRSKADGVPLQPLRRTSGVAIDKCFAGCQALDDDDDVASFTTESTTTSLYPPTTSTLPFLANKAFTVTDVHNAVRPTVHQSRRRGSDNFAGFRGLQRKSGSECLWRMTPTMTARPSNTAPTVIGARTA